MRTESLAMPAGFHSKPGRVPNAWPTAEENEVFVTSFFLSLAELTPRTDESYVL
jgi:hypothetical protein